MKSTQGLALVAAVGLGIALGVRDRGGVGVVSQAGPGSRTDLTSAYSLPRLTSLTGRNLMNSLTPGDNCQSDKDCDAGEVCLGESPPDDPLPSPGQCFETCRNAGDCADDGYICTDAACAGPVQEPGKGEVFLCQQAYSEANCGQFRATHLVTEELDTDGNARSLGIHGDCFDEQLGPTVPPGECLFTVEAVQYRREPSTGATLFDAVCLDLDTNDSVPTCSPMQRESLYFSVGPSLGPHFGGEAGIAAGISGTAWAGFDVDLGFSIPITMHRRFRYPMWRRFTGRVGGNVLIDSGIGSVVARESVVFAHNAFDGDVTFFVTKPEGMKLTLGYKRLAGDAVCTTDPCPEAFAGALEATAGLLGPSAVAGEDAFESDFDIQEVIEALDDETRAIDDIIEELKGRIAEKINAAFDIVQDYLNPENSGISAAQRSVLVDRMMDLLRGRIQENLEEIREMARDLVGCPDN